MTDSPVDVKALAEPVRAGLDAVAWRYKYDDGKWNVQKNIPSWYESFMTDVTLEPLYPADALLSAQEEAAGLRVERDEWRANATEFKDLCALWEARSDAFEAKLADAVGVLEPFAHSADWHEKIHGVDCDDGREVLTRMSHIRRARALLTSIKETGDAR